MKWRTIVITGLTGVALMGSVVLLVRGYAGLSCAVLGCAWLIWSCAPIRRARGSVHD
jgi:hypothetical protein